MGDSEAGAGKIFQKVSRDLQRWKQTQTVYSDGPDRMSSGDFPGKIYLYCCFLVKMWYTAFSLRLKCLIVQISTDAVQMFGLQQITSFTFDR